MTETSPEWSKSASIVADALKQVDEKEIVQVIMSGIERYSYDVHGSAESDIIPILRDLQEAAEGRIRSV